MKVLYIVRSGVVVESVRYSCGQIVLENSKQYKQLKKRMKNQIVEEYNPKCFAVECDTDNLHTVIEALPEELRLAKRDKQTLEEVVAKMLEACNVVVDKPVASSNVAIKARIQKPDAVLPDDVVVEAKILTKEVEEVKADAPEVVEPAKKARKQKGE